MSDETVQALNNLIDAIGEVMRTTGWGRHKIVRYVEGCIRVQYDGMGTTAEVVVPHVSTVDEP